MADGKRKLLYDIAINQIGWLGESFAGKFNPTSCNPYRMQDVEELKTEEDIRLESSVGFDVLGKHLQTIANLKK